MASLPCNQGGHHRRAARCCRIRFDPEYQMSIVGMSDKNHFDAGCVFCRMKIDHDLSCEPTNELLYSGTFHYVISGLGAWVPGYVLLVTHQHFNNFSLVPDETRAEF